MNDDRLHLIHIREAIERIQTYVAGGKEVFISEIMVQDAVLRNLHTPSESTTRISDTTKAKMPSVPWRDIAGFRNVVVHDYLEVDLNQIWDIIVNDLPPLKAAAGDTLSD